MEESLVSRSGLLSFFHDFLRKAVEDRYLKEETSKKSFHLRLAEYFERHATGDRKADELPWQLKEAEEWERLKDSITNLDMFHSLMTETKRYEPTGYWLLLGDRYDMVESYQASLQQYEQSSPDSKSLAYTYNLVADFLSNNAKYDAAEPLFRRALDISERVLGKDHPETATSLNSLAKLLVVKGDFAGAEPLFRRALDIDERVLGKDTPNTAVSLNDLAKLFAIKGDYAGAEPLFRRALDIHERVLGKDHPDTATSLNNLALLLDSKGDYEGAEPLYRRALAIYEKVLGRDNPDTKQTLLNLKQLLKVKKKP